MLKGEDIYSTYSIIDNACHIPCGASRVARDLFISDGLCIYSWTSFWRYKMKYLMKIVVTTLVMVGLVSQISFVSAFGPQGVEIEKLTEWEVTNSSLGGELLLSDSPEMVTADGILYQDKVKGHIRLFFYHVNGTKTAKRMDVTLENKSNETAHITVSQYSLGGPGYGWMEVGKGTLTSYLAGSKGYQINIPPGGIMPLSSSISETAVLPNMLINGIYDCVTDRPITVTVMMMSILDDSEKFSKTAKILPADNFHLRGTFAGANQQIASVHPYDPDEDGAVALTLADNKVDPYLIGIDATNGTKVVNYGNYGVVYQILLPSKGKGKTAYYLAPMGGDYAGAIGINNPNVNWSPLATPMGRLNFGKDRTKDFAFLGTYDGGEPLSFTFSPPGASNLPIKIVFVPQ
jgi:hypothetical protein